jgi:nucleotide-binding universal stress UspA family protein
MAAGRPHEQARNRERVDHASGSRRLCDEVTTPSPGMREAAVSAGMATMQALRQRPNGTIVSVIDDPAGAEAAIRVARWLADRFDSRMVLVGVADDPEGVLEMVAARHGVADEEQRIAVGDPAEAVARIAAEEAADVIVLGAQHGLRARTLRSSLASDLAATAPCPVVVAPPRPLYPNGDRRSRTA